MLKFTIGLPRSGKSTFCRKWQQECLYPPRIVVSGDSFRYAVYGKEFNRKHEGMVFATMDIAICALLLTGYDVIIDETATTNETIKRYLAIDINAVPVPFNVSAEICRKRAMADNKSYLIPVIDDMAERCERLIQDLDWRMETLRKEVADRQKLDVII